MARTVRRLLRRVSSLVSDRFLFVVFAVAVGFAMIGWLSFIAWLVAATSAWLFELNG